MTGARIICRETKPTKQKITYKNTHKYKDAMWFSPEKSVVTPELNVCVHSHPGHLILEYLLGATGHLLSWRHFRGEAQCPVYLLVAELTSSRAALVCKFNSTEEHISQHYYTQGEKKTIWLAGWEMTKINK